MKEIRLKEISLVNFKGIRNLQMEFNRKLTSVYGRNASGKTTIFDAFTWLLFGKNSEDRKQFGIKTIDDNGNIIPRIPHEVTAIIEINGVDVMLTRRLKEKWQKKRGSAVEEFKGNEEERLYNDVPMSVKDWSEKINEICSEEVFKMITNPLYFTSMSWQKQREMLIEMAGDVSTDEIINTNKKAFGKLIDSLNGKTLDEYKREIGAKKKRVKDEIDTLPSRIEERRMDVREVYDWSLLQSILHHKEDKLKELDEQIADKSKLANSVNDEAVRIVSERSRIEMEIAKTKTAVEFEIQSRELEEQRRYTENEQSYKFRTNEISMTNKDIDDEQKRIVQLQQERESLLNEWRSIKSRILDIDENTFVCPTCGRPLDVDQIEAKQKEIEARFNAQKASDLQANKEKGIKVKERIAIHERTLAKLTTLLDGYIAKQEELAKALKVKPYQRTAEELETEVMNNDRVKSLIHKLNEFNEAHRESSKAVDNYESLSEEIDKLSEARNVIREEIAQIREQLAMKSVIEQNVERIKNLEEQLRNANEELARLEGIEFTIQEYTKTRITMLEERINSMFKFVTFRLFETQINGGEVETCKAQVGGIPFDDLNNAKRINAGIDIINAICNAMDMTAPIVIDNAEALNDIISTKSQLVRLVVSEDNNLRIA